MIRINVGGREYESWDDLPEEVRVQLLAAGIDPGPDGRLDSFDLARAGGSVSRRTVVTGPGGAPLSPALLDVLGSIADALGPSRRRAPTRAPSRVRPATTALVQADAAPDQVTSERPGRVPLLLGWIVIAGTVLLVATVVLIGLSGA